MVSLSHFLYLLVVIQIQKGIFIGFQKLLLIPYLCMWDHVFNTFFEVLLIIYEVSMTTKYEYGYIEICMTQHGYDGMENLKNEDTILLLILF